MYFSQYVCVDDTRNKNHKNRFSFACQKKKKKNVNAKTEKQNQNHDWQYEIFSIPPHSPQHTTTQKQHSNPTTDGIF